MRNLTINRVLFALLATASVTAALPFQQAVEAQHPVAGDKVAAMELRIPVLALTELNADECQAALAKLEVKVFACPGCDAVAYRADKCTKCSVELRPEKRVALRGVKVQPAEGSVTARLAPGLHVGLSDVKQALQVVAMKVDETRMHLPAPATLVLTGVGEGVREKALLALREAKLFSEIVAQRGEDEGTLRILVHDASPKATLAALRIALEPTGAKLSDVRWGAASKAKV